MSVPDNIRQAVKKQYNADDVKLVSDSDEGDKKVFAFGMLPNSTIQGWFPIGDLDELEEKLQDKGEL